MDATVFKQLSAIAYENAGIRLRENKQTLMAARVSRRMRALGLKSERQYLSFLTGDNTGDELAQFLDVIATNHTTFFRERDHFDFLRDVMQQELDDGKRRWRIWSAASSTGQEPYSLAILLHQFLDTKQVDYKILGTDISNKALRIAHAAIYGSAAISGLSKAVRSRYFSRVASISQEEPEFQVQRHIRQSVVFARLNLSQPPFPMQGPLDTVFCRNVMIYFDAPVRQRLITEIERLLRPDGYLFIGHSETLAQVKHGLETVRPSIYRKRDEK